MQGRPAIDPDQRPLCDLPSQVNTAADVLVHLRKDHRVVTQDSAEVLQNSLAPYGYWYCNRDQKYIGANVGKPSPDGMRPFTYKKCKFCPAMPLVFQHMHHSQLVHDGNAVIEPDDTPPAVPGSTTAIPPLKEVFSTHVPIIRHIPPVVRPEIAELFRYALQGALDARNSEEAVQRFTKVMLLPAALLGAPKLSGSEASGAGHHTVINSIKRRIIMWRVGPTPALD